MKIGFPNHPRKDILKEIEWIGKNKFDFVEFFLEEDEATPESINVAAVNKLLKKYGLGSIAHTAWYLPIGSPVKQLRRCAVNEIIRYFPLAKAIGARHITVHSQWAPHLFSKHEGVLFQVDSLKKLVHAAKKYGLGILYEPTDSVKDSVDVAAEIFDNVPGLFLNLDIGHANLHGRKPDVFIRKFHDRIMHVHLHDNNGREDLHLPLGAGIVDVEGSIKLLKKFYDGTITLEVFSKDKDYVLMSRDKLREIWK